MMTDAELVDAAARAMGWKFRQPSGGVFGDRDYWFTNDEPIRFVYGWNPLAVDADGEPTESAKAQLWDVLGWLVKCCRSDGIGLGFCPEEEGGPYALGVPVEYLVFPLYSSTLPRALLLAAAAVGEKGGEGE